MTAADIVAFNELKRTVEARRKREAELVEDIRQLKARIAEALNREAATARQVRVPLQYRRHDQAYAWFEQVEAERQDVWSPFGKCWR